jgi:hypothetical protein
MKHISLTFRPSILVAMSLLFCCTYSTSAQVDLVAEEVRESDPPQDSIYHPGEPIEVFWRVSNAGDSGSGSYTLEFYIGDDKIGSESAPGLRADGRYPDRVTFSIPNGIPNGVYRLSMVVLYEDDVTPGNNETESREFTIAEKGPPDLEIDSLYIVYNGKEKISYNDDWVTLRYWPKNSGHATSGRYTLEVFIDNSHLASDNCDPVVGHDRGGWREMSFQLPEDIGTGRYDIEVQVSCPDDSNPANNSATVRVNVARKASPKISVQYVDAAEGIYEPGDSIQVAVDVKCGNGQLSGELGLDFYASMDDNISTSDYRIQSRDFSNLEPKESYTFNTTCYFPQNMPDGDYYIGIVVDYPEEGEVVHDGIPVWVGAPVDLTVQTVSVTDGTYLPNDQIQVFSLVKNNGEGTSESYTIDFYLSTDRTIDPADTRIAYVMRDGLAPGAQHSYETTCQLPINIPAGKFYIGSMITYAKDDDPANNTGLDIGPINLVHPAGYVYGRADYLDTYKKRHPIRYACVGVYAEDNNGDPQDDILLGQTHTNPDGDYAVTLPSDEQGAGDIYVKVLAEGVSGAYPETTSRICVLKDAKLKETYSLLSTAYLHPRAASVIINLTASRYDEFAVFDSIVEGFCKAKTAFDVELPEISVYWPSADGDTYFDPCNLEIYIAYDDDLDRDIIMHEYGHYIAEVYGVALGSVGANPIHFWDLDLRRHPVWRTDEHALNLAFREAWATVFSIASQYGDNRYPGSGNSKYDNKQNGVSSANQVDLNNYNTGSHFPGQYFENMNAGALWDIFKNIKVDTSDYGVLAGPSLAMIWTISRNYQPDNIVGFWNSWFQEYDDEQKMKTIFYRHGMSFDMPGE